jgi:hypothetical protein
MKAMSAGIQKIADDLKNLGDGATLSQRLEVIFRDVTPFIISVGGSLAKALWQGFTTVAVSIWNSMDWATSSRRGSSSRSAVRRVRRLRSSGTRSFAA